MKPILLALMVLAAVASDPAHEVALTREMIEDAAIRYDDEGLRLGRERAARLAAEGEAAGGGTNLTWNDDLTAPAGEGIALPAQ